MAEPVDHYAQLGVPRTASPAVVKRAYRRLVLRLHPDRNRSAAAGEQLRAVNAAWSVLKDPARRAQYDAALPPPPPAASAAPVRRAGLLEGLGVVVGGVLSELGRRWRLGQDLRYTLELDLAEACLGCTRDITFAAPVRCEACAGRGEVAGAPCAACGGEGVVARERAFAVRVPPGTGDGTVVRLPRAGVPGAGGGPEGDLFIAVAVRPHPLLARHGDDLRCVAPVPITLALTGGPLDVPTLEGPATVLVPAGVSGGRTLRLPGRGVPRPDGGRGDLIVVVEVEMPGSLPAEVIALLVEATRGSPGTAYPRSAAFRAAVTAAGEPR